MYKELVWKSAFVLTYFKKTFSIIGPYGEKSEPAYYVQVQCNLPVK